MTRAPHNSAAMSETEPFTETRPSEEHRFPCDQCGADLRFQPGTDKLVCDHCGFEKLLEDTGGQHAPIRELDFRAALDARLSDAEVEDKRVSTCPNCGALVEFDAATHATQCPFCGTPVVADTGLHRQIKPKGLLPFALTEPDARAALTTWLGSLWFAPSALTEYARKGRKMQGVYVPFWTYDAQTSSNYTGARGTVYYETRTVHRNGRTETEQVERVSWTPVRGHVARFFDDVLVLASKALPKRFTDALEPWDLSALEPYRPEFLAGFRSEAYTVELAEGYDEARRYMDRMIERDVRFDIGGDRQRVSSIDTDVSEVTFKHVLLPVWLAAYSFRGKTYRFVVNGRTGRVKGERPWSVWKITIAAIILAAIAGAVGYYAATHQG